MGYQRSTLILALGATAWAAGSAGDPPPIPADASATVTVTAEATPVEIVKTPNPVLVFDRAVLDARGADNLGDLLQSLLPGQVFASGGAGTAATIGLGRPQDTVVTLDGIRLSDASGLGGVNLSAISLAGIDRIEVQQGPCSTRFGSDAQAGVVALYSAGHAKEGVSGQVRLGVGTDGIRQGAFAPAYGWGGGWVRASVSAQQEDAATPADHRYRSSGAFLGLGQQLGEDTLLTVNYLNTFSGVPIPIIYVTAPPRDASQYDPARQDFSRTEVFSGALRTTFTPALTGELTLGQALETRLEPDMTTQAPTNRYLSRRNQAGGSLTWKPVEANALQGGFEAYQESAFSFGAADPATGRHLALFVEDQAEVGGGWRLVAALRDERDRLTFPGAGGGFQDDAITHLTWKLGANWIFAENWRFYASAGTAFANPLLFQAIYNAQYQGQALGNERSTTYQTGLTFERGPWTAGLELNRTTYADLIYYDPQGGQWIPQWGGYWTGIYRNGSGLRLQSATLRGGRRTERWSLEGFYRNQEFRDTLAAPGQAFLNNAVLRKPFQSFGLDGHWTVRALRLEGRWSWTGPRYDYGVPNPSYAQAAAFREHFNDLSLAASLALGKDLVVALHSDHVLQPRTTREAWLGGARDLQNDASQVYGYPAQPATWSAEMRYRF